MSWIWSGPTQNQLVITSFLLLGASVPAYIAGWVAVRNGLVSLLTVPIDDFALGMTAFAMCLAGLGALALGLAVFYCVAGIAR